jgi:hypothetical protein
VAPDPRHADVVFSDAESSIFRYDRRTRQTQDISVAPMDVSGHGAGELAHRFQWTTPLIAPALEPGTLYTAAEAVFRSTDEGHSWTKISGDLTRNDKTKQMPSGGPIQLDITSVEYYDTIFALAESPIAKGLLWAGTDDGLVWISGDTGKTWKKVTPATMPEWGTVSQIDPSTHQAGTAFLAVDRHRLDDFKPYAWVTKDFGATWTSIAKGLPEQAYIHVVREDPKQPGLLYAGTELGVFVSFDNGTTWRPLQMNLPVTPVTDLVVHDDDLVIATNGRSFWVLDDVEPLRERASGFNAEATHLFLPRRALRLHYNPFPDRRRPVGENGPQGAVVDYWLPEKPNKEVVLDILDAKGQLVRHFSSRPNPHLSEPPPEWVDMVRTPDTLSAQPGLNRCVWDLRWNEPTQIPGAVYIGLPPWGPLALPGTYTVRLTVDGQTQSVPLDLSLDPRSHAQEGDLRAQFDLGLKTRSLIDQLHQTVNQIRTARAQMQMLRDRFKELPATMALALEIDAICQKATAIEAALIQVKLGSSEGSLRFPVMLNEQLDTFRYGIDASDAAPTQGQREVFDTFAQRLAVQTDLWKGLLLRDIPELNRKILTSDVNLVNPLAETQEKRVP